MVTIYHQVNLNWSSLNITISVTENILDKVEHKNLFKYFLKEETIKIALHAFTYSFANVFDCKFCTDIRNKTFAFCKAWNLTGKSHHLT